MKCEICGKDYNTSRGFGGHLSYFHNMTRKEYYDKFLKQPGDGICEVCGKPTTWNRINYHKTCSIQCGSRNPNRQDKIRKTNLEKYGVVNVYQIDKIKQHSIDAIKQQKRNYKCLNCGKDCGIKKFCSNSCKEQYRQSNQSYNNRKQAIQTCKDQFDGKMNNGAWPTRKSKIEQFEKEHNCTSVKKICTQYGQAWRVLDLPRIMINKQNSAISNDYLPKIKEFANKYGLTAHSKIEDVLLQDIKNFYNGQILHNTRKIITPLELDFYLPDLKLAIEFNGTYWHSINAGKDKKYHLHKSILCREKGIRLIHIYEFEPYQVQLQLLKALILGIDNYPKNDFNKNNLINTIPKPAKIYSNNHIIVYGAGKLY